MCGTPAPAGVLAAGNRSSLDSFGLLISMVTCLVTMLVTWPSVDSAQYRTVPTTRTDESAVL
jgi:hypothetical protein